MSCVCRKGYLESLQGSSQGENDEPNIDGFVKSRHSGENRSPESS
jgi:hypothetical protein